MKFKVLVVVFSVFLISSFAFIVSSCGILDDEESTKVDCDKICNKEKECDKDMTDDEVKECKSECEKINSSGYYQDSFIKSANECYNKACSEINSCIEKSSSSCKAPNYTPFINTYCEKAIECGADITKETCTSELKKVFEEEMKEEGVLKCTTDKLFSDAASCVKKAKCETFENDIDKCMEETMDIK